MDETNHHTSDPAWQRAYVIAANAIRLAIPSEQNAGGDDPLTPEVCKALLALSSELENRSSLSSGTP